MALTQITVSYGSAVYAPSNEPAEGTVQLALAGEAVSSGVTLAAVPVTCRFGNGVLFGSFWTNGESGLQATVTENVVGAANPLPYVVNIPTSGTLDLSTASRSTTPASPVDTFVLASSVGQVGGVAGPLNASGQLNPNSLAVVAARAVTKGLIAMTEDLGMVPSQSGVTAGRLFVYPFVAGQSGVVNSVIAAYQTATAGNVNTNTFIGIYNAAGTVLLGQTADLAGFLTTTTGARVQQPIGSPSLVAGTQYYAALLNNYTTTGPQWMGLRLFGTNSGPTTRCLVSAGTMPSLPASLPALSASATNSMQAIEFSP
jgi:hypothetical protein